VLIRIVPDSSPARKRLAHRRESFLLHSHPVLSCLVRSILATVCRFDHASAAGLEDGLQFIREGSGTAFDPVVVAEVIHRFREPWQSRLAA
jgi:hypothetical protein